MNPRDPSATGTDDRRVDARVPANCSIRVHFEAQEIQGRAENVSQNGALFLSNDPVRVTIEFEEDGVIKRESGRIVRAQRMSGESVGWAVEID